MWRWIAVPILAAGFATGADRTALSGNWQLDAAHSHFGHDKLKSETLSINQKDDSIQMTENLTDPDGKATKLAIDCNTMGKECKTNDEQVTMYYNGDRLIMIEMRHGNSNVIKRRLKPSDDGKSLSMEVMHIAPPGENETFVFTKQ